MYIYRITHKTNYKSYIGQSINHPTKGRWPDHCKSHSSLIGQAIQRYGKDKFWFIIEEDSILTQEELNRKEKEYIDKFNSLQPKGYNYLYGTNKIPNPYLCVEKDIIPSDESLSEKLNNSINESLLQDDWLGNISTTSGIDKLNSFMLSLSLSDIYKILESPDILYRTGKRQHYLSIFSSKEAFGEYEVAFFRNLHKVKLSLMIKELSKEGYKVI